MSRCYACCQENCGYSSCSCVCHRIERNDGMAPMFPAKEPEVAKTREQMKKGSKAKLIHEWAHKDDRYRLVAVGKWTAGYEDAFLIEKLEQDGLGEPAWRQLRKIEINSSNGNAYNDDGAITLLISAVRSLCADLRPIQPGFTNAKTE